MKQFFWLTVLGLVLAGCSKEDAAEMSADEAAAVAEQVTDMATDIPESPDADTEALVVVEESAAEAEPEDQTIVLARADDELAAVRNWQFKEGKNYTRMIPTQPTVGGADKIEVAEVFMYSCPHCYDLEAYINRWAEDKDPSIRFVRIPASFNQLALLHAQLYYTEIFLGKSGKLKDPIAFRNMVLEE